MCARLGEPQPSHFSAICKKAFMMLFLVNNNNNNNFEMYFLLLLCADLCLRFCLHAFTMNSLLISSLFYLLTLRVLWWTGLLVLLQLNTIMLSNDKKQNCTRRGKCRALKRGWLVNNRSIKKREENKQRVPNQQTRWGSSDITFSPALFVKTPFMVVFEIQGPH